MSIIRPPISGDSPQDSWANQVTEAINKGLLAPSVNPSEAAVINVDSFSAATVYLYTRTTTAVAPAAIAQDLTYDYSQAGFTTSPPFGSANWETSPPGTANGDYLWVTTVNISANVAQEIIPFASWSTPTVFSVNGQSSIVVNAFKRATSLPSTPTGGSYSFTTQTLTPPSGWSVSIPSGTDPVYISTAIATVSGTSGVDSSLSWSAAVKMVENGTDGDAGPELESGLVYYTTAQASNPGTPSATDYNFTTGVFTGLTSGWQTNPVTVNITTTTGLYWSSKFRINQGPNDANPTIVFNTPIPSVNFGTNIQSDNYITGSSGWQIQRASGDAEFNNIDIRGNIEATNWDGSASTGVYIYPVAGRLYDSYDTFSTTPTSLASGSWTLSNHYNFANNPSNTVITPTSWNDFVDSPSNRRILKFRKDSSVTRFIANLVPGDTISIYLNYPTYSNTFANFNISEAGFITAASSDNDYGYLVLSGINGSTTFQWAGTSTSLKANTFLKFYPGNVGYTFQKNGDAAINGGTLNVSNLVVEGTLSASNINAGLIVNTASGVSGGYAAGGPWYKSVELVASNSPDYISNILYSIIGHAFFETQTLYVALVRVYPGYVSYAQSNSTFSTSNISSSIGGIGYISGVPWCQTVDYRAMPGRSPGFSGGHISLVSGLANADPTSLYMVIGRVSSLYLYVDVSGQLQEIREEV